MKEKKANCPVPEDQRPENEYKKLKASLDFSWSVESDEVFVKNLLKLFIVTYTVSLVIFLNSYNLEQHFHDLLVYVPTFANILVMLFTVRSYLGWNYVYERLIQATVSYEESGWYDGQIWVKTNDILTQDRLIGTYELLPILKRLKTTIISVLIITVCNDSIWNFIIK